MQVKTEARGEDGSVTEFVDVLMAPFKVPDRGLEWELECEGLLQLASTLLDPAIPSGKVRSIIQTSADHRLYVEPPQCKIGTGPAVVLFCLLLVSSVMSPATHLPDLMVNKWTLFCVSLSC